MSKHVLSCAGLKGGDDSDNGEDGGGDNKRSKLVKYKQNIFFLITKKKDFQILKKIHVGKS